MSNLDGNRLTHAYGGVESWTPFDGKVEKRAPTADDWKGYHLGCFWFNRITKNLWYLAGLVGNQADWKLLSVGLLSGILTLTGNIGGAVSPDGAGNVDFVGAGSLEVVGNPGANTLLIQGLGGKNPAILFTEDVGTASPDGVGNINILGGTGIDTLGAGSTVTVSVDGSFATQYDCDAGSAIPVANILDIIGDGTYITTLGGANIVEISLTGLVAQQYDGDVGSAVAAAGILNIIGDGFNISTLAGGNIVEVSLNDPGDGIVLSNGGNLLGINGTDGQVIIAATAGLPTFADITSTGGTINITGGPNTLNLEASAGPGFVNAGDNININPVNTVNLNETIHWPDTNAGGTSGMIYLGGAAGIGGTRFMHNYGWTGTGIYANTFLGSEAGNLTMTATGYGFAQNLVGIGTEALMSITTGNANTACGAGALKLCTTGGANTGIGDIALSSLTTGDHNTAVGAFALPGGTGDDNTALGYNALSTTSGSRNIGIGYNAGKNFSTNQSSNIIIGHFGSAGDNHTTRIGTPGSPGTTTIGLQDKCFIGGIRPITTIYPDAIPVLIDGQHQLGTVSSSIRTKNTVDDMGDDSSDILKLRPVTFEYNAYKGLKQFGLIAEEVIEVMPRLVVLDDDGLPLTVKYHELPAILLNELKKAITRIEDLEKKLELLEK